MAIPTPRAMPATMIDQKKSTAGQMSRLNIFSDFSHLHLAGNPLQPLHPSVASLLQFPIIVAPHRISPTELFLNCAVFGFFPRAIAAKNCPFYAQQRTGGYSSPLSTATRTREAWIRSFRDFRISYPQSAKNRPIFRTFQQKRIPLRKKGARRIYSARIST